jgi:two-component system invasion response regulator UvrY
MTHVAPHNGETSPPIRVLYVEDHPETAESIGRLFSQQPDLVLVNTLHDAGNLMQEARNHDAQVVLMDLSLPGPDPLTAMRQILDELPGMHAIVLSVIDDPTHVDECLDAGALGYFSKSDAPAELFAGIRAVMKDQVVLGSVIRERLAMRRGRQGAADGPRA